MNKTITFLFLLFSVGLIAQTTTKERPSINIKKATGAIKIDGILDESDWGISEMAADFYISTPLDTGYAKSKTEVLITYDDKNIYVAARCYDYLEGDFVIQSLKRDFSYPKTDAFAVYLDPFNDKTNGFCFGVNPMGAQREGLLQVGGIYGVTTAWDNSWNSVVVRHEGYWVVEMAIPFKTIRFNAGTTQWGINFSRNDLKRNENSAWSPVPRNFNIATMTYAGILNWDVPVKKAGRNISVIPFTAANVSRDFEKNEPYKLTGNFGGDLKFAITPSLNLDLTFNPDFSQVEVDRQVTNLTRFSIFFPERRQFFIENSDLFSDFGFRSNTPFFSRKIGIKSGKQIKLLGGAKLSGKLNENWRIGAINIVTEKDSELNEEANNYSVIAVQRQLFNKSKNEFLHKNFGRSNIGGIFVNKQQMNGVKFDPVNFNRILGVDFNHASTNNQFYGKTFYHQSFNNQSSKNSYSHGTSIAYDIPQLFVEWRHEIVGENYLTDVGFVPRLDNFNPIERIIEKKKFTHFEPYIQYKYYPKKSKIKFHGPAAYLNEYLDEDLKENDRRLNFSYIVEFMNSASARITSSNRSVTLSYDTDVTFSGNPAIEAGTYEFTMVELFLSTNTRKPLNANITSSYGDYYNGTLFSVDAEVLFRKQPWGIFTLNYTRNEIRLPAPYSDANIDLIGPKVELSFTKSVFFTSIIQYNTQADNLNIYARFQWRFKPMSDLFIVYSDNYNAINFDEKNRGIAVKFVYWLNL